MNKHQFLVANFIYFTFNFPYDFLKEIFKNEREYLHFKSKFDSYNKSSNSALAVLKLFTEMSEDNQVIFLDWVENNYCFNESIKKTSENIN